MADKELILQIMRDSYDAEVKPTETEQVSAQAMQMWTASGQAPFYIGTTQRVEGLQNKMTVREAITHIDTQYVMHILQDMRAIAEIVQPGKADEFVSKIVDNIKGTVRGIRRVKNAKKMMSSMVAGVRLSDARADNRNKFQHGGNFNQLDKYHICGLMWIKGFLSYYLKDAKGVSQEITFISTVCKKFSAQKAVNEKTGALYAVVLKYAKEGSKKDNLNPRDDASIEVFSSLLQAYRQRTITEWDMCMHLLNIAIKQRTGNKYHVAYTTDTATLVQTDGSVTLYSMCDHSYLTLRRGASAKAVDPKDTRKALKKAGKKAGKKAAKKPDAAGAQEQKDEEEEEEVEEYADDGFSSYATEDDYSDMTALPVAQADEDDKLDDILTFVDEIVKEAAETVPPVAAQVERLNTSDKSKAWMRKHETKVRRRLLLQKKTQADDALREMRAMADEDTSARMVRAAIHHEKIRAEMDAKMGRESLVELRRLDIGARIGQRSVEQFLDAAEAALLQANEAVESSRVNVASKDTFRTFIDKMYNTLRQAARIDRDIEVPDHLMHVVARIQLCSRQATRMCEVLDKVESAAHAAHILSLMRTCLNKLEFIYTTAYFTYDSHYSYLSWKNKVDALRANKDQACSAMHLAFVRLRHARERRKDIEQSVRRQASVDATQSVTAKSVQRIQQAAQEVRDAEAAYRTFTNLYSPLQNFDIEKASQEYSDQLLIATEEVHLCQLAYNEYSDYLNQAIEHFPYVQSRLEAAIGVDYVPANDLEDQDKRKALYDRFLTLQTTISQNAGADYAEKRQWFDQINEIQTELLGLVKPDPISEHPEVLDFE